MVLAWINNGSMWVKMGVTDIEGVAQTAQVGDLNLSIASRYMQLSVHLCTPRVQITFTLKIKDCLSSSHLTHHENFEHELENTVCVPGSINQGQCKPESNK